jgi:hypothetical protein
MSEIQCECGSIVLNMKTHIKTKKHKHNLIDIQRAKERKEYYDNHRTERNARAVELYHTMRKEGISIHGKLNKFNCECGSIIRKDAKSDHLKSLKHLNYILSLQPKSES